MVSPHPDDETLRATAYVAMAVSRGDTVVLLAVTDGGGKAVRAALVRYPGAEVYAAAHPWDTNVDHVNVWQACRDSGAAVVRYLKTPTYAAGALATYRLTDLRVGQDAVAAYWWTLGPRTFVRAHRDALVANAYWSRVTRS